MGSGSYGPYSGTGSGSQPYAETYSVVPKELAVDKQNKNVYNNKTGYFKNPTATNIEKSIQNDKIYINGHVAHGPRMYVLNKNGDMILGVRYNPNDGSNKSPHPTLVGGKNPRVKCAGMVTFSKGKIIGINNMSGHFRPDIKSMGKVYGYLQKLQKKFPNVFSESFKMEK